MAEDFPGGRKKVLNAEDGEKKIKIVSWNINGMRTLDMNEVLRKVGCSVLSVQETKLARSNLDQSQVIPEGYSSYFTFSTNRIGYSGVATFCCKSWSPEKAEEGLSQPPPSNQNAKDLIGNYPEITSVEEDSHVKYANADGRTVITQHRVQLPSGTQRPLTIINVYCPRLRDDPEDASNNRDFKMTFHDMIQRRAKLLVESGSFVVLLGDINISHRWIDHCDGDPKLFVATDFRKLLTKFLSETDPAGFVDSFRHFYPDKVSAFTCWNTKLNARENNYGTRIDYIFVDKQLAAYLEKAEIHYDIMGSDHCPISVTFHSLRPVPSETLPSFATKFYFEFKGKQQNLKDFLQPNAQRTNGNESIAREKTNKDHTVSRKRPMESSSSAKGSAPKKVQMSLHSFFGQPSKAQAEDKVDAKEPVTQENDQYSIPCEFKVQRNPAASDAWKKLLKAPQVPTCQGHQEPCVRRTVRKKGVNFGREFWACSHGVGKSTDPNANCNFFQWVKGST